MRTILSAAVAGVIALAPVVLVSSPAQAITDVTKYGFQTSSTMTNPVVETATTTTGPNNSVVTTRAKVTVTVTLQTAAAADLEMPLRLYAASDADKAIAGASTNAYRDIDELVATAGDVIGNDTIMIPQGSFSASVDIPIYDDKLDEDDIQTISVAPTAAWLTDHVNNNTPDYAPISAGVGAGKIYIKDDDATPTVSLGEAAVATEGTPVAFPLTLSGLSEKDVTVVANTANGVTSGDNYGATGGNGSTGDYTTLLNSTVTISAKAPSTFISVDTRDDGIIEASPEKFTLTISKPTNATLGTMVTSTGSINDTGPAPTAVLSIGTAQWTNNVLDAQSDQDTVISPEGNSGETKATVTVTLSSASSIPVKVGYDFADGAMYTATNGKDYKGMAGTVTIPAGQTTGTFTIPIIGDTLYEPGAWDSVMNTGARGENFKVVLSSPNGSVNSSSLGADNAVNFLLQDDDTTANQATFSVSNLDVKEGNSGSTVAKFPITLSAPVDQDLSFTATTDMNTMTLSATGNNDDTPGAGDVAAITTSNITIPAGSKVGYIEIGVNGDTTYEKNEGVDISVALATSTDLVNTTAAPGTSHTGRFTVVNDDAAPTFKFNDASAPEGSQVRVGGTVVGVAQDPYTLAFAVGPATSAAGINPGEVPATPDVDYDKPTIANFTIPAGKTGVVTIEPEGFPSTPRVSTNLANVYLSSDDIDEPTEYFTITAMESGTTLGIAPSTGVYKIQDDPEDMPPAVSIGDASVDEKDGTVDVKVDTKWLPSNAATSTTQTIELPWWTADGTAKAGDDYMAAQGVLKIEPGKTSGMITVKIMDDMLKEPDETFWVKLGAPKTAGVVVEKGTGTVTIHSEDTVSPAAPTISAPAMIDGPGSVAITGKALKGTAVELWGAPVAATKKPLTKLGWVNATSAGTYKFTRALNATGYRFAVKAQSVVSKEITVMVGQDPALALKSSTKGKVTITVTADPKLAGRAVVIQKWSGGKWSNTAWKGTTNSMGVWTATGSATAGSVWTLRASVAGNSAVGVSAGYSGSKKITIHK